MDTPTVQIHNIATGEQYVRDMTAEELAEREVMQAEAEAQAEVKVAKAIARQALLEKLGITEEEAQLLLGGI